MGDVAGLNNFRLSAKEWMTRTNAIGIISRAGRYGGTYAHKDIAFEFAMWISPEFKVYLIHEFQRLKSEENAKLGWSAKRELAKINYHIHTSAVGRHLIPERLTSEQARLVFASEADVLNVALFGMTAKQWRDANTDLEGNIRDYASINQLICLSNMESMNSVLIRGLSHQISGNGVAGPFLVGQFYQMVLDGIYSDSQSVDEYVFEQI